MLGWLKAAPVIFILSGCVFTAVEQAARTEVEAVEGEVSALRLAEAVRSELSAVRVIEHQPYVGLARMVDEDAPAWLRSWW